MRVRYQTSNTLRRPRTPKHTQPLRRPTSPLRIRRHPLQILIKRPLNRPLRHPKITRLQPLIKPPHALLPEYLPNNRHTPRRKATRTLPSSRSRSRRSSAGSSFRSQLHARLDHPDGVRRAPGDDTRESRRGEVHVRVLAALVERVRDDLLAVSVCEEIDRAGGDDPDECGA